ncbi:MAG: TRAP transporter small permease [Emcibacter sp.]|nr:TRAP transporter small permease [Emcibacter sp.]
MIRLLDNALKAILALLMAGMVVAVLWQIISRYVLVEPSAWTEETARLLLVWLGILGGSYAYRTSAHLGLDLLAQKLAPRHQFKLGMVIDFCVMAFAAVVMVFGGMSLVIMTYELTQLTAVLHLPMAYVYGVLPLSGSLIVIYAGLSIAARCRALQSCSEGEARL